jgi:hypothetical protein
MKLLMLLGGLIGFSTGLVFTWANESQWPSMLWRSCLAAYVAGMLLKWWGKIWVQSLAEVTYQKQHAARTAPVNQTTHK